MQSFLTAFDLSILQWVMVGGAAILIGLNKAGMVGLSLLAVPMLASIFGGKISTGIVATFLVIGDFMAVLSYRKSVRFDKFWGLLPWTLAGMLLALFVGAKMSDQVFKMFIAAAIIIVLVIMFLKEIKGGDLVVPNRWYINALVGMLGGFTSLIGNVAGPILAVYFLSLRLDKNEFIATRAWFFWMVNLLKLPMHFFVWKTINVQTLVLDSFIIPVILIGALAGVYIVKKIPEKPYRVFIMVATLVSAFALFF